ncbi:hypothetical protein MTO96_045450 [Rhipicephalus appendiculatus]
MARLLIVSVLAVSVACAASYQTKISTGLYDSGSSYGGSSYGSGSYGGYGGGLGSYGGYGSSGYGGYGGGLSSLRPWTWQSWIWKRQLR